MNINSITNYASPFVVTTSDDTSLKTAIEIMQESDIRHLPVTRLGEIVGIISDRDIKLFDNRDFAEKFTVADIMVTQLIFVDESVGLKEAVEKLLATKSGSCLLKTADGEVSGIFTVIDALRALKEKL